VGRIAAREVRVALRVNRVFAQTDARRAAGLATVVRAEEHMRELAGQRVYFRSRLRRGETAPTRSTGDRGDRRAGTLARNPPSDSFDGYLASAGMNSGSRAGACSRRAAADALPAFLERAAVKLNELLSAGVAAKRPELTAVFRAMMLGQKHELSDEQNAEFMHSGTMHLFAINGCTSAWSRWRCTRCSRCCGVRGRSRRSSRSRCCGWMRHDGRVAVGGCGRSSDRVASKRRSCSGDR